MTYPIYNVDKGLGITPLKTINHLGHLPIREDCLDERGEFVLGGRVADQALPCLLMRVDSDGWIGEIDCMMCRIKTRRR